MLGYLLWRACGSMLTVNPTSTAPEHKNIRYRWVVAFAAVGALVTVTQVWKNIRDEAARSEFETKLTGGENYCYFRAVLDDPKPGGGYEWVLINKWQRSIPFHKMCRYQAVDGKDKFIECWPSDTCIPHSIQQTTANESPIMPGKYRFIWFAANEWEQILEISVSSNGDSAQTGIIYRDGKEIWRFPDVTR